MLAAGSKLSCYELLGRIGAGAMGEVWRARDTRLEREVAIKVLPPHFADDEERLARFEREARTLAALNHPNVGQIFDVDQVDDTCFLVLELVPGESLAERLARGPLALGEALEVAREIAEGLEAAHEAGVIHRDLKPDNVRITPEGRVKLLDFGLAKPMRAAGEGQSSADSALSTEAGRVLGTPTYMAPEQARGKPIDRRVDLWALGCVLYECLTAQRAFRGETLSDVLAAVLEKEPDWERLPAATPARVRELLERCLAKDLARRQRDAGDAALELDAARAARPEPAGAALPRQSPALVPWLVAALGLSLGVSAWLRASPGPAAQDERAPTVRFELALPTGTRLCPSDRLMNEIAIAPDGLRIVYMVEEKGQTAVYSRRLDQAQATRLDLGPDARGPTFSPDGAWLAFVSDSGTLMRVPLDGGPAQRIADVPQPGGNAAWLADGSIVLVDVGRRNLLEIDARGTERVLAEPLDGFEGFENVAASPDLSWVLVDGWKGLGVSDYRVMAVDRSSGAVQVLVENASSPVAVGEDILVFQRGAALLALRFDFGRRQPLGEPRQIVPSVSTDRWGGSSQFAVSPQGTLVLAPGKRRGEGRRMVWASADGSVEPILVQPDAFGQTVGLAVDGSTLLVDTLREREELWTIDLIGGGMSPVIAGELFGAVLSPRGDRVVYTIRTADGLEVRRAPVGGGAPTVLARGQLRPTCTSADGRFVLLTGNLDPAQPEQPDILVLDTSREPASVEPVIATARQEADAHLSPDEKWLAFEANRAGRGEVFVRAWPAGERDWKVSDGGGHAPRWSPDGRTLYYLGPQLLAVDLVLSADPDAPRVTVGPARVVLDDLAFVEVQSYGIAPDGRVAKVELAAWELEQNRLEVVVGWREELERLLDGER